MFTGLRAMLLAVLLPMVPLAVAVAPHGARAYEGEHYSWTYYLALHAGFTERQAFQIASAAYAIDWHPNTGPMPDGHWGNIEGAAAATKPKLRAMWSKFHAFGRHEVLRDIHEGLGYLKRFAKYGGLDDRFRPGIVAAKEAQEQRLWQDGLAARNPGPFIHFRQDRYSHNGWYDLFGHGAASHFPDYLSNDPNVAWQMTQATMDELVRFRAAYCAMSAPDRSCARRVGGPDMARIRVVFDRLVAANPLPVQVEDRAGLLDSLKRFSLTYDYQGDDRTPSEQGLGAIPWAARFYGNLARSAAGISLRLWRSNAEAGLKSWLLGMPGPDHDKSLAVIRRAVDEDKARGAAFADFTTGGELKKYVAERAARKLDRTELPRKWLPYQYDAEGRIAAAKATYAVEDPRVETGDVQASFAQGAGEGRIRVSLKLPLGLKEMPKLGFLDRLPTVVEATLTDVATPVRIVKRDTLGPGGKTLNLAVEIPAAEFDPAVSKWRVEVHVYGLQPREFEFPFKTRRRMVAYGHLVRTCLGEGDALIAGMRAGDVAEDTRMGYPGGKLPSVEWFRQVWLQVSLRFEDITKVDGVVTYCGTSYAFKGTADASHAFTVRGQASDPIFKVGTMTLRGAVTAGDLASGPMTFSGTGVFSVPNSRCRGTALRAHEVHGMNTTDCAFEWTATTDCAKFPDIQQSRRICRDYNGG